MSLQEALRATAEAHRQAQAKLLEERLLEYHASLYSKASAYDNAVILAGFAAFFALWAGTADDIPRFARLITVAMMGVSLMSYVAVTIGQMLLRQYHLEWRQANLFHTHSDPESFNKAWNDVQTDFDRRQAGIARLATSGFWLSLATGFAAGLTLAYNVLAIAFGWPALTG